MKESRRQRRQRSEDPQRGRPTGLPSPSGGFGWLAALVPLAIYWPILGYGFLLDDFVLFETSPSLSSLGSIFQGFWRDLGGVRIGSEEVISGYYRPVFLALSTLYYQTVGAKPGAWHFGIGRAHV